MKLITLPVKKVLKIVVMSSPLWINCAWALETTVPQPIPLNHNTTLNTRHNDSELNLSPFNREQWALTETEWQRYLTLLQGIRGSISPRSLSPLEVLGIHAETSKERKKYARLWAKLLREDTEKTLAFQKAYQEAVQDLYGSQPLFEKTALNSLRATQALGAGEPKRSQLQTGDRLLVFMKVKDCKPCVELTRKVLVLSQQHNLQVDFYFTDTEEPQDNPKIIDWAKQQQLDPKSLAQKTLTLNHDQGTLRKISGNLLSEVPAVYRLNGGQLQRMPL